MKMSTYMDSLFNYKIPLPEPFETMKNKKTSVSSKYSNGTAATLCAAPIKAIHAVCKCMNGTGKGAVGIIDHRTAAEYKSSMSEDEYHLVVYDSSSGAITASVYDQNIETFESYPLNVSGRDGAAVFMAMMPILLDDEEFKVAFDEYYKQFCAGHPDIKASTDWMGILCDNAYRRIKDETCPAHIKANVEKSGNLFRISQTQLDSGQYTPVEVTAGEFIIFARTERAKIKKAGIIVEHEDFAGQYMLQKRILTPSEQELVPKLPPWYIIPGEVVDICKHAHDSTGKPTQMRNFLLRGPAGTGKTMGAKAIAAGLGLPYMKYTCSAGTEIFDFIGQIFPDSDEESGQDEASAEARRQLKELGGINYENVAKIMNLPDIDDMDYDPVGVYQRLTGIMNPNAGSQDCMKVILELVTKKISSLSRTEEMPVGNGQSFTYIETDFIKALKNGYLIELQEPTTIMQPGVMVGLNSLLEQEGSITLPTGEIINRHPDAVVVVTTNVSYEGCRSMNQSIIDRMNLVHDVELPTTDVMVERAMSITGSNDEYQISQMVKVVDDMADYCRKNSISDGNVGMRSLIDWIISSDITGDPYHSALCTVISKATADEIDRESLISSVLEPIFPPKKRRAA